MKTKIKVAQPPPKPFHLKLVLPHEYRALFEQFAKENDRDMKKHGAHILKNAADEWKRQREAQSNGSPVAA